MLPDIFRFPLDTLDPHTDADPELNLTEGSVTLLQRVRVMAATWQALGVVTSASSRRGRLSLFVDIGDNHPFYSKSAGRMQTVALACLRVDHLGSAIACAWIGAAYFGDAEIDIMEADPHDGLTIPVDPPSSAAGVDEAIAWLEAQCRRPVQRLEWTRDRETVARLWMLADTGRPLVVGGPRQLWQDPPTADTVLQIRP
ncbi:MAG TPA: hypothetical protein VGS80_04440 [Ktedonobacterales bacterium]|nr:hypothetical protein [Ktedonobacterales bacterium]